MCAIPLERVLAQVCVCVVGRHAPAYTRLAFRSMQNQRRNYSIDKFI